MSGSDIDIITQIRDLLRTNDITNNRELISLLTKAVHQLEDKEAVSGTPTSAAQLARLLKGHAYSPNEVSFRRFASLNITNILLCEHELTVLAYSYAVNPELLLCPGAAENLRKLLADYSTFSIA